MLCGTHIFLLTLMREDNLLVDYITDRLYLLSGAVVHGVNALFIRDN